MILDNIEKIKSLLVFREGIFYYIQVIQRKKENPDLQKTDYKRYQVFVTSKEDLERHLPRIIKTCEDYNARAYISIIPRSLERLAKACLKEYAERVCQEDYSRVWDIPNRAALSPETKAPKILPKPYRMFDVDEAEKCDGIIAFLRENRINVLFKIPTPNGYHIIAEAFNPSCIAKYKKGEDYVFPDDIGRCTYREECNTILYASWEIS